MSNHLENIKKNTITILSGEGGASILRLISLALLTRTLDVQEFGVYVLLLAYVEIISKLVYFQTWQAIVKFGAEALGKGNSRRAFLQLLRSCIRIETLSTFIAFSVAVGASGVFVDFFGISRDQQILIYILSVSVLLRVGEMAVGIFRVLDKFEYQSYVVAGSALSQLCIFIVIASVAPSLKTFIYGTVVNLGLAFCARVTLSARLIRARFGRAGDAKDGAAPYSVNVAALRSFVFFQSVAISIKTISRQLDVLVVGKLFSAEAAGIYRLAVRIASVIANMANPLYQAVFPEFAHLVASGRSADARALTFKLGKYMLLFSFCAYVAFLVVGQPAISLVFGGGYTSSHGVALVYLVPVFLALVTIGLTPLQLAHGRARQNMAIQLATTSIYVGALFVFTLPLSGESDYMPGLYAAAGSYAVYYLVWIYLTISSLRASNHL